MQEEIKSKRNERSAEKQGDLLLLDLLHRINEREKIVSRPTKPDKELQDG